MAEALVGLGIQLGAIVMEATILGIDAYWKKKKEKQRETEEKTLEDYNHPIPGATLSGSFVKEGHVLKNWKKRVFALKGTTLTYHQAGKEGRVLGEIELQGSRVYVKTRHTCSEFGERECIVVEDTKNGKTFQFFPWCEDKSASSQQIQNWLAVIEECGGSVVSAP